MKTLHLICNAHIDPVWLWDWEEGAAAALSTFRSAVNLANEFDYIFCHNEALLFQWIEEYDPALFRELQALSEAGKLKIMGGWYLQPDANLPTGESFIRQMMEGRRYFDEKFGQHPTTAVNVDSFGHSLGLPQLLRGCGYDSYLIGRPFPQQNVFPDNFFWEGMDGSCVRVCRVSNGYNTLLGEAAKKIRGVLESQKDRETAVVLWGVGNHGGGPSRRDLGEIAALMAESEVQILHSTPEQYMAESAGDLPVFRKSLNPCMPGCLTSMVRVKQQHRALEAALYSAEKIASAAAIQTGMAYPMEELEDAEKDLMLSEFHDILPGSAIRAGEETGLRKLSHGLELTSRVRTRAFFALAAREKRAAPGTYPVLVYNPHPYPVDTVIDISFILENQNWSPTFTDFTAYDGETALPTQVVQEPSMLNLDWAKRVLFPCRLKPMVLNRFDLVPRVVEHRPEMPSVHGDVCFENEIMRARIGGKTGLLESYYVNGLELLSGPAVPVLYRDNADPWAMSDAQLKHLPGEVLDSFRLMTPQEAGKFAGAAGEISPIRIIEDGPVAQEVETLLCCRSSALRINWRFYRHSPEVDVTLHLLFLEQDALVKWHLPLAFSGEIRGQEAYSQEILATDGREVASQDWVAASDGEKTFAVLKQGCYGLDCSDRELRLTLIRGACYAAHPIEDRPLLRQDRVMARMDQGQRDFSFRLTGGSAKTVAQELERRAQVFAERPYALQMFPTGDASTQESLMTLEGDGVVLTACKASRNGGYILRFHNNTGADAECLCKFPGMGIEETLRFGPYQIRTCRLTAGRLETCEQFEI